MISNNDETENFLREVFQEMNARAEDNSEGAPAERSDVNDGAPPSYETVCPRQ